MLPLDLGWQGWYTLAVIVSMIGALVRELFRPDLVVLSALGLLLAAGIIPPETGLDGFSNPAVITVGSLYVIAAGIDRTGALRFIDNLFSRSTHTGLSSTLAKIMVPSAFSSAFLNNTPIVAMLIPRLERIAEQIGRPPSKLLIPLSYAAIAGGMTTLIGTSTNLVASGLLQEAGHPGFSLFQLSWVGVPIVVLVLVYMTVVGYRFLPDTGMPYEKSAADVTEYQFDLRVAPRSPLIGRTVEEAQLRNLDDAFLIHIRRAAHVIGPISPEEVLQEGDVLTFVGEPFMLDRLQRRPGLERTVETPGRYDGTRPLPLYEAVVSETSSLVGKTLQQANFRERFQGVVVAIHRQEERIPGALGNVPLRAGDLLLIEAQPGFDERLASQRSEFYLVASRDREQRPRREKVGLAVGLLAGMIVLHLIGLIPLVTAAFLAALAMILSGCIYPAEVQQSLDFSVLIVIAAALGIGRAVDASGLANVAAALIESIAAGFGITGVVVALYLITNMLTEFITNNAAVVLMIPVALAAAADLSVEPTAFAVTVTIAASASFISPIGYQTNLMVMGAGGYSFRDYFRTGLPITIGALIITTIVVQVMWL